jgi:hypothetical protein
MFKHTMSFGTCPTEEDCVQTIDPEYETKARLEAIKYRELLHKKFGIPPNTDSLSIHRERHDFGSYYDVVFDYDPSDEEQVKYAFHVEANLPKRWE